MADQLHEGRRIKVRTILAQHTLEAIAADVRGFVPLQQFDRSALWIVGASFKRSVI
jgi:hypothetical protein